VVVEYIIVKGFEYIGKLVSLPIEIQQYFTIR